jgi:hypothetical protein
VAGSGLVYTHTHTCLQTTPFFTQTAFLRSTPFYPAPFLAQDAFISAVAGSGAGRGGPPRSLRAPAHPSRSRSAARQGCDEGDGRGEARDGTEGRREMVHEGGERRHTREARAGTRGRREATHEGGERRHTREARDGTGGRRETTHEACAERREAAAITRTPPSIRGRACHGSWTIPWLMNHTMAHQPCHGSWTIPWHMKLTMAHEPCHGSWTMPAQSQIIAGDARAHHPWHGSVLASALR